MRSCYGDLQLMLQNVTCHAMLSQVICTEGCNSCLEGASQWRLSAKHSLQKRPKLLFPSGLLRHCFAETFATAADKLATDWQQLGSLQQAPLGLLQPETLSQLPLHNLHSLKHIVSAVSCLPAELLTCWTCMVLSMISNAAGTHQVSLLDSALFERQVSCAGKLAYERKER